MTQNNLNESVAYLKERGFQDPEIGIVLGTGLGKLADDITDSVIAYYSHIPHFPLSTLEFHSGKLIFGMLEGRKVVVMLGRFHRYEGYDPTDITYPIRVMHQLGIKKLLISNAGGAINLNFRKGEIMLIEDHINLQGDSPLAFKNVAEFGKRFVDMSNPYDSSMRSLLQDIAAEHRITLQKGVYASLIGPQLETRAEYRYLKVIGADAVGMSTVPEVIVANHLQLPVVAVTVLTDECNPDDLSPLDVQDIIATAARTEPDMIVLFKALIRRISV
ncbi:purine-nucleoside phosphorylase [Sinomicrobium oceani]|nr:purine-nucleoside phosphorylase [Sinomicrobium oceani]